MQLNLTIWNQTIETAKAKAAGNPRWLTAIEKAADAVINGKWIITELVDGCMITTESGETYKANGHCQCQAFAHGQACKHRAAARLIDLYNETLAARRVSTATVMTTAAISNPKAERVQLIDSIKTRWPKTWPPLYTELLARYGKSDLDMLDDDSLRRVSLAISM